ncbi:hypothetical protein KIPB_014919, partial [Kipferlia bialata]|eukprot:g14919.t1
MERERGIKDMMRINGVGSFHYWTSCALYMCGTSLVVEAVIVLVGRTFGISMFETQPLELLLIVFLVNGVCQ